MTTTERKETNAEYHADTVYYSHSMLEVYHKSPARFEAIYISQTLPRPPSTPAMVLGSLLHCLVLEPHQLWTHFYCAVDCESRRGKKWELAVDTAKGAGLECVLPSQAVEAERMAEAITNHPLAAKLLGMEGITEEPIRWEDENGHLLKCKPDRLIPDGSLNCMLYPELKSSITPTPEEFAKQAYNFGYHRQMAHYGDGITAKYDRLCHSIFIVVGKEEPHDVFVYQPDDEFINLGHYENTVTRTALENSLQRNEWHAKDQNELQTLSLPAWARRKAE